MFCPVMAQVYPTNTTTFILHPIPGFQKSMWSCADEEFSHDLRAAQIPGGLFYGLPQKKIWPHIFGRRRTKPLRLNFFAGGVENILGPFFKFCAKLNVSLSRQSKHSPLREPFRGGASAAGALRVAANHLRLCSAPAQTEPTNASKPASSCVT